MNILKSRHITTKGSACTMCRGTTDELTATVGCDSSRRGHMMFCITEYPVNPRCT